MHVPAEDDGAEAKASFRDGEELVLRDQLAAKLAVDVDSGQFDLGIIFEKLWKRLDGDFGAHFRGFGEATQRVTVLEVRTW